tara:strand:- start:2580 stop:4106 length:1527 start_codon:yes stop_codon:yes gene_type:complete
MATDYKLRIKAQDQSKKGFNSVNKNINSTQNAMKKLAGVFAGAFAVRQIVQFGNEALQLADNIGKTADSLRVSTEFLQKYQFAAGQSGMSTEEFNKSMLVFSKLVGQASIRTSEVGRTLEKFGIQIKNANGESRAVEDVFLDLMKALDGVENAFERNAILADVFGRAGLKMSVLMKDGSEAMKDLAESADGIMDEETIRKAEAFNDTMARLKRQVLEPLQSAFINTSKAILDFAEAMGLIKPDLFTKSTEELNTALNEQKDILDRLLVTQEGINKSNHRGLAQTDKQIKKAEEQIGLLDKALEQRRKQAEIQEKLKISTDANSDSQDNFNNTIKDSIVITKNFADTVDGQLTAAFKNFFDATNQQFLDFKDLATAVTTAVINELINVFIVQKAVGMVKGALTDIGSLFNGDFGNAVDGMSDFDGGGYTGKGIRAGGMDGKGGFMAMVHPNETVIDHTKGQGMQAAPTVNFNISTVDAAGFDQLLASRKGLITSIINNAMNNQGKMGVV